MNTPPKAVFKFENFKVTHFQFNEPAKDILDLNISLIPSGLYFKSKGVFEVCIDFTADADETPDPVVKATLKALFNFEEGTDYDNIPDYFYLNSIAIVYPYLRAFISNLTLQANHQPLVLPVLNLTGLEKPLKENTKVME
jgi:preprotein translocase subunit SecB